MRTLSSPKTRNSKVITPLIVVGVAMGVAAGVMRDKWAGSPLYAVGFVLFLVLVALFYFWRGGTWRLADSVVEHADGLRIRRGSQERLVTYREIARVRHRVMASVSICVLELHSPNEFGSSVEFIPLTDEESLAQLKVDLWKHLEILVATAQPRSAS